MIYILEDDDSIRKLVTYALESQGVAAAGFAAPSAFYAAMEEQLPSLLLLDIMLPEEDGISILKKLRADPCTARIPVIMLTARGEEYDRVEGLDAGADDYVTKPFGMMELLARVRALLRRANMSGPAGLSGAAEAHADGPGPQDPGTGPRAVSGANPRTETLQTDRSGAGSVRRSEGALHSEGTNRSEGTRRNEGTFRSGGTR
ncbi:MAG: response regulator, partial [Eubacteriales bacterium]|nr:response regulator [Eubacteriales bacterium]